MVKVTEFAFTGYPVTDLTRARAFYEGVLNLTPGHAVEGDGKGWVEYEVGPHTLAITNMAADWHPSSQGGSVALEVADFDAAITALREKGVKFHLEPFASPVCRMAYVADPDGNSICIHKRNAAP